MGRIGTEAYDGLKNYFRSRALRSEARARFPEEVEELSAIGACTALNMYEQAGAGLARNALQSCSLKKWFRRESGHGITLTAHSHADHSPWLAFFKESLSTAKTLFFHARVRRLRRRSRTNKCKQSIQNQSFFQ